MKILVTGCNGQLGNEIRKIAGDYSAMSFIYTDVAELDITNINKIDEFVTANPVDVIINCAAYTNVDKSETEREIAYKVNVTAAGNLAEIAVKHKAMLVHISSDYVFGGTSYKPYNEDDPANPQGYYAITKFQGEEAILKTDAKAMIIRTAWLYSEFGNNFVKTMLRLGKEKKELNVVFDQVGSPTYAADLAKAILDILPKYNIQGITIYHYTNEGVCSWYDFAHKIMELSGSPCKINPIETKDYPLPAPRPHFSVLNKSKIKCTFGIAIPHWESSLKICLKKLGSS